MSKRIPFQFKLMHHRPDEGLHTPDEWNRFVSNGLLDWFEAEPVVRRMVPLKGFDLFDSYIFFQTEDVGWRITLSQIVQDRMSKWQLEASGPAKFERLGRAIITSTLIGNWNLSCECLRNKHAEIAPIEGKDESFSPVGWLCKCGNL